MKTLDMYWATNKSWWDIVDHRPEIKEDAPEEAKESFKRYIEQITEK